ncbi:MAG TPA: NUDIX hydrolase, partial [Actinomycetes bacterium]|nr:NUDIX hydrolase [Actinomycetes bacterium]
RPAATVVLLRDSPQGVEAYLLRRVTTMAFAAGMHVVPGGTVDPRDADTALQWAGPPPTAWESRLTARTALVRSLTCAAVRETFEESGVLLAGPSPDEVVADTTGPLWETDRAALLDRSLAFAELLDRRGLVLRADLLAPWTHWITPEFEERRYDTRFFVASLPAGQRTRDVGGESDRAVWMRPVEAYDGFREGSLAMLPPTAVTLSELMPYDTVADVLAAANERTIRPLLPRAVLGDGQIVLLMPDDEGYER